MTSSHIDYYQAFQIQLEEIDRCLDKVHDSGLLVDKMIDQLMFQTLAYIRPKKPEFIIHHRASNSKYKNTDAQKNREKVFTF